MRFIYVYFFLLSFCFEFTYSQSDSLTLLTTGNPVLNTLLGSMVSKNTNYGNIYSAAIKFEADDNWGGGSYKSRLSFFTMNGTSLTERLRITKDGNLGIGISNPGNYRLSLQEASSSSGYGLRIINAAGDKSFQTWVSSAAAILDAEGTTDLYLRTAGQDRLYIRNNGDIGISTTNPTGKFHVNTPVTIGSAISGASGVYNLTVGGADAGIFLQRSGGSEPFVLVYTQTPGSGGQFRGLDAGGVRYTNGSGLTEWMRINSSGNMGIGTTSPQKRTHISSYATSTQLRLERTGSSVGFSDIGSDNIGLRFFIGADDGIPEVTMTSSGTLLVNKTSTSNSWAKLDIGGGIRSDSIIVNISGADFVFEKDHRLLSLEEVEKYILEHKHLQDVPSAVEMEKDGVSVGMLQSKLLQKVEELTLYLIEQNKIINSQKENNLLLKQEVENLKQLVKNKILSEIQ